MNPTAADQGQRSRRDEYPEKYSLQERPNPDFAESLHGEPGTNQVECDGQADDAQMLQHRIGRLENVNISVGNSREAEKRE